MPRRAGDVTTANSKGLVVKPNPSSERRWAYDESHRLALYIYLNKYIKIIYVEKNIVSLRNIVSLIRIYEHIH